MLNTAIPVFFAARFFHPGIGRDWRAMGAFTALLNAAPVSLAYVIDVDGVRDANSIADEIASPFFAAMTV